MLFKLLSQIVDIICVNWFARAYVFTRVKRIDHQILEDHFDHPVNRIKVDFGRHVGISEPKLLSSTLYLNFNVRFELERLLFHVYPFQLELRQYILILLSHLLLDRPNFIVHQFMGLLFKVLQIFVLFFLIFGDVLLEVSE